MNEKIIHINTSKEYDVVIGRNLLGNAGEMIRKAADPRIVAIVSDDNVFALYEPVLKESLTRQGISVEQFVFPHGECSKCISVYEELLEFLCERRLTRSDMVAALGGGVTGDLAGFAAATYQRGINYVQIPTTLLAAVDSSVGGKTAVNLRGGKNQAGCFYQPSLVICDVDTLSTLPEREYKNGCAEVIKYGMIKDEAFLMNLKERDAHEWIDDVIARCVEMKREVVSADEFDTGERMLLNFGHTLGHGVEKCSDFSVSHGFAVAQGMAVITKNAQIKGICAEGTYELLTGILEKYGLPAVIKYDPEDIAKAACVDKKSQGGQISLIIPEAPGKCVIRKIPAAEIIQWAS